MCASHPFPSGRPRAGGMRGARTGAENTGTVKNYGCFIVVNGESWANKSCCGFIG